MVLEKRQRPVEQKRDPNINPHIYGQVIFDKGNFVEAIQWRKDFFFQQMVLGQLDIHMQKINIHLDLIAYIKIN